MLLEKYDEIIQEQLAEGIIEKVTDEPKGKEFYIPHKPVIRESAGSTKIRIVFDEFARANERSPSLKNLLLECTCEKSVQGSDFCWRLEAGIPLDMDTRRRP